MADTPPVPKPRQTAKPKMPRTVTADTTDKSGNGGKSETPRETPPARPTPTAAKPRANSLEARLTDFLAIAAIPFATTGDMYSAQIISQRTPALAKNLSELANENASIKKALNRMLEGGAWGGVAMSFAAIVIPIAQRYGAVPGEDPFMFMYPDAPERPARGIPSPPAGFGGWTGDQGSSMGAPVPMPPSTGGTPPAAVSVIPGGENGDDPTIPQYLPGAPPGVVTVAATAAGHTDAR